MDAAIYYSPSEIKTEPALIAPVIDIRIKTMTKKWSLHHLPVPPSVNALYRDRFTNGVRSAGRAKTKDYVDYENEVMGWRLENLSEANRVRAMIQGLHENQALKVGYAFHFPSEQILTKAGSPKKNDISNRIKALDDSVCKHVLGCDDSLFWECSGIQKFANPTLTDSFVEMTFEIVELELTFL
jgi:hypothetical protein